MKGLKGNKKMPDELRNDILRFCENNPSADWETIAMVFDISSEQAYRFYLDSILAY